MTDIIIFLWVVVLLAVEIFGIYALNIMTKAVKKYIERNGGQ